jgi:hypothetical protein
MQLWYLRQPIVLLAARECDRVAAASGACRLQGAYILYYCCTINCCTFNVSVSTDLMDVQARSLCTSLNTVTLSPVVGHEFTCHLHKRRRSSCACLRAVIAAAQPVQPQRTLARHAPLPHTVSPPCLMPQPPPPSYRPPRRIPVRNTALDEW